jgi:hypothetical protein
MRLGRSRAVLQWYMALRNAYRYGLWGLVLGAFWVCCLLTSDAASQFRLGCFAEAVACWAVMGVWHGLRLLLYDTLVHPAGMAV